MLPNRPRLRRGTGAVSFRNVDRPFSCFITCPRSQITKYNECAALRETNLFKFILPILQIQMLLDLGVLTSESDNLLPVKVIE